MAIINKLDMVCLYTLLGDNKSDQTMVMAATTDKNYSPTITFAGCLS
jgi:hypothetical protein